MTTQLVTCKGDVVRGTFPTPTHPCGFERTVRVIATLNGMPRTPCNACGHVPTDILDAHNVAFPANVIDLTEMNDILNCGATRGVFNRVRIADDGQFCYIVNSAMASSDTRNGVFVALSFQLPTDQPRPGFLPAGYSEGYQRHPYSTGGSANVVPGTIFTSQGGLGGGASNVDSNVTCGADVDNISFV